eukprot:1151097-Pelagomonas_calceolata.AAC.1
MNRMNTNRHHVLSFCIKALSKSRYVLSLIGMDACQNERLLDQGKEDPGNISQAIPYWVFPNGTGSSARHQSRPDAVFVRSFPGRPALLDPTNVPTQDRDIHLVKLKLCPKTNPLPTLEAATAQHASTTQEGYRR